MKNTGLHTNLPWICKLFWLTIVLLASASSAVLAQSQTPKLDFGGQIRADMTYFSTQSPTTRQPPFVWRFNATPRIRYGRWDVQTLMNIGSYEDRFAQSFNKLGITARRGWATLHAGHRTMQFSPLTLSGHLFFGSGLELRPGRFRFQAVYGKFQRAVEPQVNDPLVRPTFKRMGYGFSLGVGRPSNFVDIHFFRAQDDTTSIDFSRAPSPLQPKQNFVTGITVEQRFAHRLYLTLNAAASAFTNNMFADTVTIKDEFFADDLAYRIFKPKYSSQYLGAITGRLEYRQKATNFGVEYKFVEPNYSTLGTYFFQNDVERYGTFARWVMLDKKLHANVSLAHEHNNLKRNKTTENTRQNATLTLRYQPQRGRVFNVNYAGYRTVQDRRDTNQVMVAILEQFTNSLNGLASIKLNDNTLQVNASFLNRINRLSNSVDFSSYSTSVSYALPLAEELSIAPEIKYSRYLFSAINNSTRIGAGATVTKNIKSKSLNLNGGFLYTLAMLNGQATSNTYRTSVSANYQVTGRQRLTLRAFHSLTQRSTNLLNEFRLDVGWAWSL